MQTRLIVCVAATTLWSWDMGARSARCDDLQKKAATETASMTSRARPAIERGLAFLEKDALKWRTERGCATCHHGTMTIWAMGEAKAQGYPVGAETFDAMAQWTKSRFVERIREPRDPRPGWRLVSVPAIYLGMMSYNLPILSRDEINAIAVHLARHQEEDGAWELPPPKNGAPPIWESRETLALLALLAWEPYVPAEPKEADAARASRDKAMAWLAKTKSSDTTQALTLRLLLDARTGKSATQLQPAIDRVLKHQKADGGWSQTPDLASDAYATGQALYALNFAGVKFERPEIQRAVGFLAANQQADGSWPMTPRNHSGVEATRKPVRFPVPITYFGSAWATLGLVRFVPAAPDTATKRQLAFDQIRGFHGKYEVDEKDPARPVVRVDLRYYEVSDKELATFTELLQAFPRLTTLQLKSSKITDAGLAHLKNLSHLRVVALENAAVTDAGLMHLQTLTELQELSLKGTKVTEAGLRDFRKALPKVKVDR